jgi:HSP20 family protein
MLNMEKDMAIRDLVPWGRHNDRPPVEQRGAIERREYDSHPLLSLHRDVNRLFDDVFRGFGLPAFTGFGRSATWPAVETNETDTEIRISAELPGLTEKDVEAFVEDGVLTLRGERKTQTEDKDRGYTERYYGRFERQIGLPRGVEPDKVSAAFKDGVLTVSVPKSQEAIDSTRRIPINAGSA